MIKKGIRKDDPNSGYFTLPGGKLEEEEKGLENLEGRVKGAKREVKEETGIEPLNLNLIGVILFDNHERTFDNWKNPDNFLVYVYLAGSYKGVARETKEGIPFSVPKEKIDSLPSNPGDKLMYGWIKKGKKFFGVIKHKGNKIDTAGTFVDFYS